jgi:hypothetical protein
MLAASHLPKRNAPENQNRPHWGGFDYRGFESLLKSEPEVATTYEDVGDILRRTRPTHNSIKILESGLRLKAFIFRSLIHLSGCQVFEIFDRAVRPIDHHSLDAVILSYSERDWQFRLR